MTTFHICNEQYESLRTPVGLTDARVTLRKIMNRLFGHLNFAKVYSVARGRDSSVRISLVPLSLHCEFVSRSEQVFQNHIGWWLLTSRVISSLSGRGDELMIPYKARGIAKETYKNSAMSPVYG